MLKGLNMKSDIMDSTDKNIKYCKTKQWHMAGMCINSIKFVLNSCFGINFEKLDASQYWYIFAVFSIKHHF